MTIPRRRFLALSSAAALLPTLTACAGGGRTSGNIQYWWAFNNQLQRDFFQRMVVDAYPEARSGWT